MSSALTIVSWCPGGPCDPCQCSWKRYSDTTTLKYVTGLPAWDPTVTYSPGQQVEYLELPFQAGSPTLGVNPVTAGYPAWTSLDTTLLPLDQSQLCAPHWGVGGIAVGSGHAPGDIINGYIDVPLLGSWAKNGDSSLITAPPGLPPAVHVIYQGVNVFTFDPGPGTIIDFLATGNTIDRASGNVTGAPFSTGRFEGNGPGGVAIYGGAWSAKARLTLPNCIFLDGTNAHIDGPYNCVLPYTGPIPDPATLAQVSPTGDASTTGPVVFSELYNDSGGIWTDTGLTFNLAQTASLGLLIYYLHAH